MTNQYKSKYLINVFIKGELDKRRGPSTKFILPKFLNGKRVVFSIQNGDLLIEKDFSGLKVFDVDGEIRVQPGKKHFEGLVWPKENLKLKQIQAERIGDDLIIENFVKYFGEIKEKPKELKLISKEDKFKSALKYINKYINAHPDVTLEICFDKTDHFKETTLLKAKKTVVEYF